MLHRFAARSGIPAGATLPLYKPCLFPYNISNLYGQGGYTHCGKHTGVDFSYQPAVGSNLDIWPAYQGAWGPAGWSPFVYVAASAWDSDHGNYVILWHVWAGSGRIIETEYSHLGAVYAVAGSWHHWTVPIGRLCIDNSTGLCGSAWTGAHLHFEVRCRTSDYAISAMTFNPATGGTVDYSEIIYDDDRGPMLSGELYEDCGLYCDPQHPEYNENGKATKIRCLFPSSYGG